MQTMLLLGSWFFRCKYIVDDTIVYIQFDGVGFNDIGPDDFAHSATISGGKMHWGL